MAALVNLAKSGDRKAFDQIVRLTHKDAYTLALRLMGNSHDAHDVVQEAYIRAYRSIGRFRGDARFSTWMYRIVANCASSAQTKRRRHQHEELRFHDERLVDAGAGNDPAQHSALIDLRERLDAAIMLLSPRLRSVVVLRDVYGLSHQDIAKELGISVAAAKVRLHRARLRLREELMPLPGEER